MLLLVYGICSLLRRMLLGLSASWWVVLLGLERVRLRVFVSSCSVVS